MFTGFPHLMELIKKLKLTKILEMIFCLQDYWGTSPHGGGLGSAQSASLCSPKFMLISFSIRHSVQNKTHVST